jgi:ABC-type Fe3+-hydroxamate transport system substrate-binding protein
VRPDTICSRPGWAEIAAVRTNRIYEIPGEDILQPGFRLVFGFERLKEIVCG